MTPEKMQKVRQAIRILSTLSNEEWEEIPAIIAEKPNGIEKKENAESITKILRDLGIPAHIDGYHYFKEAVYIFVKTKNPEKLSITADVYPIVAKKFETSASRVERAIRHALDVAWDRGNIDVQRKIFGYTTNPKKGKPTNSEAIATIADYLKQN